MFIDPSGYINQGYDENGVWHDWDAEAFGKDSTKYQLLVALTNAYNNAPISGGDYESSEQSRIRQMADDLRVTDDTIVDNILLNDTQGAMTMGHVGVLLLNPQGEGFLFSYANRDGALPTGIGEYRFALLSVAEVARLKDGSGEVFEEITIYGDKCDEIYDRFVWNDLTADDGAKIYAKAVEIFMNPGKYNLAGNQCDNIASRVLSAGGAGYEVQYKPNASYDEYKKNRMSWEKKQ